MTTKARMLPGQRKRYLEMVEAGRKADHERDTREAKWAEERETMTDEQKAERAARLAREIEEIWG